MIAVIHTRCLAAKLCYRVGHAALELIIIVRVENIMFAVILVLYNRIQLRQTLNKRRFGFYPFALIICAVIIGTVCITAPVHISFRKIRFGIPATLVNQALQPCTIGSRFTTKYPIGSLATGFFCAHTLGEQFAFARFHVSTNNIAIAWFLIIGNGLYCGIIKAHDIGKGITKEARNAQGDIHAWTS